MPTRCASGMRRGGNLVVIGAGWIGAEIAASARQQGLDVTVLDPAPVPLGRVLGPEVGGFYRDLHADHDVKMLLGSGFAGLEGSGHVRRVLSTDGLRIEADFVVVGIGVQPRTDLAERAGLRVDNGVVVDELLRASDPGSSRQVTWPALAIPSTASTCASSTGAPPATRVAAARGMLGRGAPYDALPYFFSDQYDIGMEYRGRATDWDQVVFRVTLLVASSSPSG